METNFPADTVAAELIEVKQRPIIEERLLSLKEKWDAAAKDAEAMACTEDTIQAVKAERAKLRQEFYILEDQRKAAKKAVMDPYERFEAIYKECVSVSFMRADERFKSKIAEVENEMKRRCEEGLRDYFAELCAVHHLDWLAYERAGIKVDMASAKAKTPIKLRKQLTEFVVSVADSVDCIIALEDAGEIMAEYKRTLNASDAICIVQERRRRVEEQEKELEARKAAREREDVMVRRVEALDTPAVVEAQETAKIYYMDYRAHGTMEQLRAIKKFALENNIKLEVIKYE